MVILNSIRPVILSYDATITFCFFTLFSFPMRLFVVTVLLVLNFIFKLKRSQKMGNTFRTSCPGSVSQSAGDWSPKTSGHPAGTLPQWLCGRACANLPTAWELARTARISRWCFLWFFSSLTHGYTAS